MSMADRVAVMHDGRVLQIATPVELYERPATHFVADFIGEMNFLSGSFETDRFVVPGVGSFRPPSPAPGARWLGIRPEKLSIGVGGDNQLEGSVIDVSFYGALTHCVVAVAGLDQPVRVNVSGPLQLRVGTVVALSWKAVDAVVLAE